MEEFFARLKEHKLVQWTLAYIAVSFGMLPVLDIVAERFGWSQTVERCAIIALATGFFMMLVIAWFHGERGQKRVTRTEHVLLAVLVLLGGLSMWRIGPAAVKEAIAKPVVATPKAALPAAPVAASIPAKSIAVLPFENLSTDKGNAYFADGMQDLILTKLADIGELKVISRTSTMKYASYPDDLKTIAKQLGVATVLEGSVQKAGNQVLINVQLINAQTDGHIWADSYTRTLDNVFGVEGEVAGQIATALKAKLSPAETKRLATSLSTDPAANDLYLRGEYFLNKGDRDYDVKSYKQAIALYRQAIAKVPDFALAWAELSNAESSLVYAGGGGEDIQQLKMDARHHAEQALALAPELVEAQLATGFCDFNDGDDPAALKIFDAVLKVRPNDVEALRARGTVLALQGHYADALTVSQQALASDPRNSDAARAVGQLYQVVGRYAEAEAAYQHALALDPNNMGAKAEYSQTLLFANGDVAAAWAAVQGDDVQLRGWRIRLLMYQRKYQEALALLASIPDTPDNFPGGTKALQQAGLYRLSGDVARAKPLFEQALPLLRARLKSATGSDTTQGKVWVGIAAAELGLGHTAVALTAIAQSQALMDRSNNIVYRPVAMMSYASLYAQADRPDLAVPMLEKALATPGIGIAYSPVMLWIDPAWDPIHHDPRFAALLKKYASDAPKPGAAAGKAAAHD